MYRPAVTLRFSDGDKRLSERIVKTLGAIGSRGGVRASAVNRAPPQAASECS
jgi:hypothetical protein